jgi:hypothetical protein
MFDSQLKHSGIFEQVCHQHKNPRMHLANALPLDFIQSPSPRQAQLPNSSATFNHANTQQPEPLLSLLTDSHPLISTAIGGSLSAYSASKNYSPRFKSGAEYMERSFTPIVNTVGSVNRITGIEGGVRWFLGRRPSHNPPPAPQPGSEASHKRRKVNNPEGGRDTDGNSPPGLYAVDSHESDLPHRQRAPSQSSNAESLPAYDEQRSPSYEATQQILIRSDADTAISQASSWQSRLVLSTSGLSIAMSEESLRSLKYCLGWLRWANEHIGKVLEALKSALEQYDQGSESSTSSAIDWPSDRTDGQSSGQLIVRTDAERSALNARIAELKTDVLKTLKSVVDIVSKYAGGALPENARILVRKHLTSLPQRFRLASVGNDRSAEGRDREVIDGASRVMVLAKEGLDMMSQVSGVLDGTIVSAEEWCERLGMKKAEEQNGNKFEAEKIPGAPPIPGSANGYEGSPDVKMG